MDDAAKFVAFIGWCQVLLAALERQEPDPILKVPSAGLIQETKNILKFFTDQERSFWTDDKVRGLLAVKSNIESHEVFGTDKHWDGCKSAADKKEFLSCHYWQLQQMKKWLGF